MSYSYKLKSYYKVKKNGKYPWPCVSEKDRVISLFTDDILKKEPDGTFSKQTGLCCFGIKLKKSQVKFVRKGRILTVI